MCVVLGLNYDGIILLNKYFGINIFKEKILKIYFG